LVVKRLQETLATILSGGRVGRGICLGSSDLGLIYRWKRLKLDDCRDPTDVNWHCPIDVCTRGSWMIAETQLMWTGTVRLMSALVVAGCNQSIQIVAVDDLPLTSILI